MMFGDLTHTQPTRTVADLGVACGGYLGDTSSSEMERHPWRIGGTKMAEEC